MQLTHMSLFRFLSPRAKSVAAALFGMLLASAAAAQGLFSPVITVNDQAITRYELEQREQFLRLLRAPGDPAELAREALIEDRLKLQAVNAVGLEVTTDDVDAGVEEFASRTDLSSKEFIAALEQGGVSEETLRDFARANVAWRDLIRARFLARARPTDAEIDRALGSSGNSGVRVLLSEIIIPVTPQTVDQVDDLAQQISQVESFGAFSEAATKYSAAQSRNNGGRMNWVDINTLPAGLRPLILALTPGEVTAPIALQGSIALFQLRAIQETTPPTPRFAAIEYALYYIPGGRTAEALGTAARISEAVDNCDDLYGIAQGQPPERLERLSQKPSEIPRDVAIELAKLDDGEISTTLTRSSGQTLVLLMMCGRTSELNEDASREDIANALVQQRLTAFAQSYLDQLRADAVIIEK